MGIAVIGLAGLVGTSALAAAPTKYDRPARPERISVSASGAQSHQSAAACIATGSSTSADGRYVAFVSGADNIVANPAAHTGVCQIYWRDRKLGITRIVSVSNDGTPGLPGSDATKPGTHLGGSTEPMLSANGRYVAFSSDATNLVPGDTNLARDVFWHDVYAGRTLRVSVASDGSQAKGNPATAALLPASGGPSISDDGRYVAFTSQATNLTPNPTDFTTCVCGTAGSVYVHDTARGGRTNLASVTSDGHRVRGERASISGNGRYVVFTSTTGEQLVPGVTAGVYNVFERDLVARTTALASVASDGAQAKSLPVGCAVGSSPLATLPDPIGTVADPAEVAFSAGCGWSGARPGRSVSADGRYVTFWSEATNFVPNATCDVNTSAVTSLSCIKIFVRDMKTRRTERIDVDSYGHPLPSQGGQMGELVSRNGRYVAYERPSSDTCGSSVALPTGSVAIPTSATCKGQDAYLYDRLTGVMDWLSQSYRGGSGTAGKCSPSDVQDSRWSSPTSVTDDGRFVSFDSSLSDIVAGDTNNACDSFVRDRGPQVGVGGLNQSSGPTSLEPDCVLGLICVASDLLGDVSPDGADLIGSRLVGRDSGREVVVRWDVRQLAQVLGAPTEGLLYGMSLTYGGTRYQVRVQRLPGPDYDSAGGASFGLFRETLPGIWTHVASLQGGYGTIGDSVVTAVPLGLLGGKAQLTDVTAYTAIGSYLSGPTKVLDSLRLSR